MEPMITLSVLDYNELVMDKVKFLERVRDAINEPTSDMWTLKNNILNNLEEMIADEKKKLVKPA